MNNSAILSPSCSLEWAIKETGAHPLCLWWSLAPVLPCAQCKRPQQIQGKAPQTLAQKSSAVVFFGKLAGQAAFAVAKAPGLTRGSTTVHMF